MGGTRCTQRAGLPADPNPLREKLGEWGGAEGVRGEGVERGCGCEWRHTLPCTPHAPLSAFHALPILPSDPPLAAPLQM